MTMSEKKIIAGIVVAAIFAGLFYLFPQRKNEDINKTSNIISQPIASWQKITITEARDTMVININLPRIIIYSSNTLENEVNEAIMQHIEYSKDWFISGVSTAAEDDGETNTLNVGTEIL